MTMSSKNSEIQYKNIPKSILKGYSDGDEFINYNEEDPDLDTIVVSLPKTPRWDKIDNFGLPKEEQKFQRQIIPIKIIELQEAQHDDGEFLTQDEIWDKIETDFEYYKEEIKWIKLQWKRIIGGYWFFNNGKATYIDGWHYAYLNFFELDIGLPEYRDRDRRFFHFARFCKLDSSCFGFIYPKHRREGATYKTSCIHYFIISTLIRARGGIQSMTDDSGRDVFQKHIVDPWSQMPFFLRPNHDGGENPKAKLRFYPSSSRGKAGIKKRSKKSLRSEIEYRASSELAFDGTKLYFYHDEEVGKTKDVNINKRWEVVQLTLSTGGNSKIHGFSIHTSTVGEMDAGGGQQFRELCDNSMYGQRNANGQTASGLYILFIPAWDGLEGFVDEYGMSIINDPTPEQSEFSGKKIGAKKYIENTIEHLKTLPKKDKLLQFQREHPTTFRGCFRSNLKSPYFNMQKLEDRMDELRFDRTAVVKGDFKWVNDERFGQVEFLEHENGRFSLSKVMKPIEANRISWDSSLESYVAHNIHYCAGADPFRADKTKSSKQSLGGGAVFWGHDVRLDPFQKKMEDWQSSRFICTYLYRPQTTDDFCEDMLMMCWYYGCPMYPETNVEKVREYFTRNKCEGMLVHQYKKGKFDDLGGQQTDEKTKQKIWQLLQIQIERHCHREKHIDLLNQIYEIKDIDDMTNYDLFTAAGYAMLGADNYLDDVNSEYDTAANGGDPTNDFYSQYL